MSFLITLFLFTLKGNINTLVIKKPNRISLSPSILVKTTLTCEIDIFFTADYLLMHITNLTPHVYCFVLFM